MDENAIYVAGFFDGYCKAELESIQGEIERQGLVLYNRDLTGRIFNSALDFTDLDLIGFSYELLKNMINSGAYDLFKFWLFRMFKAVRGYGKYRVPFTIEISGVPTVYGPENIKVKISDELSDDERKYVIDRTLDLAEKISNNQIKLMRQGRFQSWFGGRIFFYDPQTSGLSEIDVDEEIRKKTEG